MAMCENAGKNKETWEYRKRGPDKRGRAISWPLNAQCLLSCQTE